MLDTINSVSVGTLALAGLAVIGKRSWLCAGAKWEVRFLELLLSLLALMCLLLGTIRWLQTPNSGSALTDAILTWSGGVAAAVAGITPKKHIHG